jgi:hypothetical protein
LDKENFLNPVAIKERKISLKNWDGNLALVDQFITPFSDPLYHSFHQHVEEISADGEAQVVDFVIKTSALPKGGPAKKILQNSSQGKPVSQDENQAILALFPSGIALKNGGAAADGGLILHLLRTVAAIITNPNAVHASAHNSIDFNSPAKNPIIILPGTFHAEFLSQKFSLRPRITNEELVVTLITDNPASDTDAINHLQTPMVMKGYNLSGGVLITKNLGIKIGTTKNSGRSHSEFATMFPLVAALRALAKNGELNGVLLTSFNFDNYDELQYLNHLYGIKRPDGKDESNSMVNAEVSISNFVTSWSGILSMHGPATNYNFSLAVKKLRKKIEKNRQKFINEGWSLELIEKILSGEAAKINSSGEVTSSKGTACLLSSAYHTPILLAPNAAESIATKNILAVTVPSGCELSETTIAAAKAGIPILVDLSNSSIQTFSSQLMTKEKISEFVIYCKNSVQMVGVAKMLKSKMSVAQIQQTSDAKRLELGNSAFLEAGINRKMFTADGELNYPKIRVRNVDEFRD